MDIKNYYLSRTAADRESLATRCGTTLGHLRNICYGKVCGEKLAINIERETKGQVAAESLRPDVDWNYMRGTRKKSKLA